MPPSLVRAATGLTMLVAGRPMLLAQGEPRFAGDGPVARQQLAWQNYGYEADDVLGTSLDLIVCASRPTDAARCQEAVLAEIERLRQILSTYDPASEISRVSLGVQSAQSPELRDLLAAYDDWSVRTGGAVDARLAQVVRLWREAARTGRAPEPAALRAALAGPGALNVDALGKAAIIDRAVAVARRLAPAGLLNLGGDLRAWGDVTWTVGVADPFQPADNAPVLTSFLLRNAAVATSGDYARPFTVVGRSYSHVIDPRTLQPVAGVRSASVVAGDCLTANALAAALTVLGPPGVASLGEMARTFGHLVVDQAGGVSRGGVFATVADSAPSAGQPSGSPAAAAPSGPAWPKGFQVGINLVIGGQSGGRGKRPYVAVWVENADHKLVRTISVFGGSGKYQSELTAWRAASVGTSPVALRAVTRATRPPGTYPLVWDGLDSSGKPVPPGTYTLKVELNQEHGNHVSTQTVLTCDGQPHTLSLPATVMSDVSAVTYGPKPASAPAPAAAP